MATYQIINGQCVLAQHCFNASDLPVESLWVPADGSIRRVIVQSVDVERNVVRYQDKRTDKVHELDLLKFQARNSLVVNSTAEWQHLVQPKSRFQRAYAEA